MTTDRDKPRPPAAERRSGTDRRVRDVAIPKGHDRRRGVEPRKPEVQEISPSDSLWASFDVELPATGSK
ncbi:MAG: hypothetical protein CFE40_14410 [Burkholderiales bacterium PBB1]|nr:MAG: hypothetical protein CFE40_14410 [Burkholderiales bacterium PBB1]